MGRVALFQRDLTWKPAPHAPNIKMDNYFHFVIKFNHKKTAAACISVSSLYTWFFHPITNEFVVKTHEQRTSVYSSQVPEIEIRANDKEGSRSFEVKKAPVGMYPQDEINQKFVVKVLDSEDI